MKNDFAMNAILGGIYFLMLVFTLWILNGTTSYEISQARAQIALLSKQVNNISSQLDEHDVGIQQMQKAQDYETLCQKLCDSIPGLEEFVRWEKRCEAINKNF